MQETCKGVNRDDEEQWGEWVALPEPTTVPYGVAGNAIEEDPRGGCGEERRNPVTEAGGEPTLLEEVQYILPTHRVEGLLDVELEEDGGLFSTVQPTRIVANKHEIIMYAPGLDESALRVGDKGVHVWA